MLTACADYDDNYHHSDINPFPLPPFVKPDPIPPKPPAMTDTVTITGELKNYDSNTRVGTVAGREFTFKDGPVNYLDELVEAW